MVYDRVRAHFVNVLNADGATNKIVTVPNAISLVRILLVPVFVWCIAVKLDIYAVSIVVACALSDFLDGFLARRFSQVTKVGKILDPIADRLLIFLTLIMLTVREILPFWPLALMFLREAMLFFQNAALVLSKKSTIPVNIVGKAGTASLMFSMPLIFFSSSEQIALKLCHAATACIDRLGVAHQVGVVILALGLLVYWLAGLFYTFQAIRQLRTTQDGAAILLATVITISVGALLLILVTIFAPGVWKV
jgi:cardiolipin synthase